MLRDPLRYTKREHLQVHQTAIKFSKQLGPTGTDRQTMSGVLQHALLPVTKKPGERNVEGTKKYKNKKKQNEQDDSVGIENKHNHSADFGQSRITPWSEPMKKGEKWRWIRLPLPPSWVIKHAATWHVKNQKGKERECKNGSQQWRCIPNAHLTVEYSKAWFFVFRTQFKSKHAQSFNRKPRNAMPLVLSKNTESP